MSIEGAVIAAIALYLAKAVYNRSKK